MITRDLKQLQRVYESLDGIDITGKHRGHLVVAHALFELTKELRNVRRAIDSLDCEDGE